jgi:hypothetical protein
MIAVAALVAACLLAVAAGRPVINDYIDLMLTEHTELVVLAPRPGQVLWTRRPYVVIGTIHQQTDTLAMMPRGDRLLQFSLTSDDEPEGERAVVSAVHLGSCRTVISLVWCQRCLSIAAAADAHGAAASVLQLVRYRVAAVRHADTATAGRGKAP